MTPYSDVANQVIEIVSSYSGDREKWVVFDVDETLLTGAHLQGRAFFQAQAMGRLHPIPTMIDLYNQLSRMGIKIAVITARHPGLMAVTERNIIEAGARGRATLYMKPRKMDKEEFKTKVRAQIYADGGIILANIGDQETDLNGGYAEHTFLLPSTY